MKILQYYGMKGYTSTERLWTTREYDN